MITKKDIVKKINRIYEDRRKTAVKKCNARIREIEETYPEIGEIKNLIALKTVALVKQKLNNIPQNEQLKLQDELNNLEATLNGLYTKYNITKEMLNPVYTCEKCKDTGYILIHGNYTKCSCYQNIYNNLAKDLIYENTNMSVISKEATFEKFNFNLFLNAYVDGINQREEIEKIYNLSKDFAKNFKHKDMKSLVFFGKPGTGKTYMSCCIANSLLKKGRTVFYSSANELFEKLADVFFGKVQDNEDSKKLDFKSLILNNDLLIIDDLGTEITNEFIKSQLFEIVNTRLLNNKKTIISTNLSSTEINDTYGSRIFSRLASNYAFYKFYEPDIRYAMSYSK